MAYIINPEFWTEIIYSLIIIIICAIIYFTTKEMYKLSFHEGIKYFRNAFLFFGIAFLARLFVEASKITGWLPHNSITSKIVFLIFLYAGLMAGFYLIYSSMWKKLGSPKKLNWLSHPIALTIAAIIIIFIFGSKTMFVLGLIFLVSAILAYSQKSAKKTPNILQLHIIYILIFISWVITTATCLFIQLSLTATIILYIISSLLFLTILYKVIRTKRAQ